MYCKYCGTEVNDTAKFCPHCGNQLTPNEGTNKPNNGYHDYQSNQNEYHDYETATNKRSEDRDWLVTLILCIFGGCLGIHSFYNGKIGIGVAQILTCGGCGIWTIVDLILICTNKYTDCDGKPLKHKI